MNNEPLPGIIAFTECVLIVTTLSYFIIQLMVSCAPRCRNKYVLYCVSRDDNNGKTVKFHLSYLIRNLKIV